MRTPDYLRSEFKLLAPQRGHIHLVPKCAEPENVTKVFYLGQQLWVFWFLAVNPEFCYQP